ncbi:uncharacterized protein SPSK_00594 [Sporothrix schenckii 1099-18]|uniref:Uncharacterized protein n=1 Tax=Sporothrix schenckii 1099-18 TaxID=1397361 RepID=A0A0F2LTX9_SPOSC|nr:uncharacterized protein SPSK_00594 [Sporothrix schenckii 1099-18]KJR79955.1 hypothetical protein SPSK_00594 [Sporothrix schenckii 1099-18]
MGLESIEDAKGKERGEDRATPKGQAGAREAGSGKEKHRSEVSLVQHNNGRERGTGLTSSETSADDGRRDSALALGLPRHIEGSTRREAAQKAKRANVYTVKEKGAQRQAENYNIHIYTLQIEVPPKSTTRPFWDTLHDDVPQSTFGVKCLADYRLEKDIAGLVSTG